MTDAKIAALMGYRSPPTPRGSSLMHRLRAVVAAAQAEQVARIEVMRAALVEAREIVAEDRDAFYYSNRLPGGSSMHPADAIVLAEYDELLRMIDEAMEER